MDSNGITKTLLNIAGTGSFKSNALVQRITSYQRKALV